MHQSKNVQDDTKVLLQWVVFSAWVNGGVSICH